MYRLAHKKVVRFEGLKCDQVRNLPSGHENLSRRMLPGDPLGREGQVRPRNALLIQVQETGTTFQGQIHSVLPVEKMLAERERIENGRHTGRLRSGEPTARV